MDTHSSRPHQLVCSSQVQPPIPHLTAGPNILFLITSLYYTNHALLNPYIRASLRIPSPRF